MKTFGDLYDFAACHTLLENAKMLKQYVIDGQPDDFMPAYTWRNLCCIASMGFEHTPKEKTPPSYVFTKYGVPFYDYMSGTVSEEEFIKYTKEMELEKS